MSHGCDMRALQQKWFQFKARLKYARRAGNAHSIHSPFLFELYTCLFKGTEPYYCFPQLERERRLLKDSAEVVEYEDQGAGSVRGSRRRRRISTLALHSLKSPVEAALLFKLCNRFQPATVLEMGTCLGITTAYMAKALPGSKVITLEGAEPLLQRAKEVWNRLGIKNIHALEGNFRDILPLALEQCKSPCLFFLDGDHQYSSMMHYWKQIQPYLNEDSIVVVDDIHWSPGMEQFWYDLIKEDENKLCIDLFSMGIIFRKSFLSKEHLTLAFP